MSSVSFPVSGPGATSATSQTAPGAQARVSAAMDRISGIESAISGLQTDLASIQQIIAQLQAELGALSPPDQSQFYKTETHTEGTPPRTVSVRVLDAAAFNAAMSTYLAKVAALEQKIGAKQSELAQKESALAQKQSELGQAQRELASAQQELERALANDRKALEEAQKRYQEAIKRAKEQQEAALKAQAEAQKAQDDLQKAQAEAQRMRQAAASVGTYDTSKKPPFQVAAGVTEDELRRANADAVKAQQAARAALQSAGNDLPTIRGNQLLPPVNQISARDYLDLMPKLASYETAAQATNAGLLGGFDPDARTAITPQMTAQMIEAWTAAGFSPADIKLALGGLGAPPPALFTTDAPNIPAGTVPRIGDGATAAEAAAWLVQYDADHETDPAARAAQNSFFVQALKDHQSDPAWIAQLYGSLGADKGAEFLGGSVLPENYENQKTAVINAQVDAVKASLVSLQAAGFNEGDMDALMKHWASDADLQVNRGLAGGGDHFNAGLAQLFAGLPAGTDPMKNAFFDSATRLALDDKSGLSDKKSNDLAAAAAFVLAGSSTSNQALRLEELQASGTLTAFTQKALSGEVRVPTVDCMAIDARDFSGKPLRDVDASYDGVASLLLNMDVADVRDGRDPGPPISDADVHTIRDTMFMEAVKVYGNGSAWAGEQSLLDAMAFTFATDSAALMPAMASENHAAVVDSDQKEGLRGFFQKALFTEPGSTYDTMLLGSITKQASDMAADLRATDAAKPGLDEEAFKAKYGMSLSEGKSQVGLMLGLVAAGLNQAVAQRKADAETTASLVGMVVDTVTSLVPGPADDQLGKVLKAIYDQAQSKTIDGLKGLGTDALKKKLVEMDGLKADVAIRQLYEFVHGIINSPGDFHDGFESGLGTDWPE